MPRSLDNGSQYSYGTIGVLTRSGDQACTVGGRPWWEWALVGVTFLNIGFCLAFTVIDLVATSKELSFEDEMSEIIMPIYPADVPFNLSNSTGFDKTINPAFNYDLVALLAMVFALILFLYGMLAEKKYELYLCPIVMGLAVIFCIPETVINEEHFVWYKACRIGICGCLTLISWVLTSLTVSENRWSEFTITGTSDGLMKMYRRLCYFTALLKLDFFIVTVLAIFCLRRGLQSELRDCLFMTGIFVLAFVSLVIGIVAVNRERKQLVFAFIILNVLMYLWIPCQMMTYPCFQDIKMCCATRLLFMFGALSAGIITVVVKTYISIELLQVYKNFGFGLTDAAFMGLVASESSSLLGRSRRRH